MAAAATSGSKGLHDQDWTMSISALRRLHLGVRDLDESEMRLLKVFLRFTGRTPHAEWSVATDEEEDLVVRDADGPRKPAVAGTAGAPVVWIVGSDAEERAAFEPALRRPLQIESFADILRAREAELGCADVGSVTKAEARRDAVPVQPMAPPPETPAARPMAAPAPAPAPAPTAPAARATRPAEPAPERVRAPVAVPAAAPVPASRPAPAPAVAAPAPATSSPRATTPSVTPAAVAPVARPTRLVKEPGRTYRLIRWPGNELMRGRPKFVRMLGFLTQRPMGVEHLVVLSGLDEASCLDLLGLLDERGLLAPVETPAVAPRAAPPTPGPAPVPTVVAAPPAPSTPPAPSAHGGMLQRLRKRLGI